MPFLVDVEVKPSKIHGKGVFALRDIPKGAKVWKFAGTASSSIEGVDGNTHENVIYDHAAFQATDSCRWRDILFGGVIHEPTVL